MSNTGDMAEQYYAWIMEQSIEGCTLSAERKDRILINATGLRGVVGFYDLNNETVIELCVERLPNEESLFFLHFELVDLSRAEELFCEMAEVIDGILNREVRHVLLCCSCGMTTSFFANKLNQCATEMGVGYDFEAKSLGEATRTGAQYVAVLLAPQVSYQRKELVEALPDTVVMELPASIFGKYDAPAALRLLIDTLDQRRVLAASDLRMARDFDHTKRVLAMSYVWREDESTLSYKVIDRGHEVLSGMLVGLDFDSHTVDDVGATLRLAGFPPEDFDAVGLAVPGMVEDGVVVNRDGDKIVRKDYATKFSGRWGVPVYVDNAAVAAASGCYVIQEDWDDVAFHAQVVGAPACDEGYVIGGEPVVGKGGFSGNLRYIAKDFSLSMDLDDAAWRYDGTRELVARYLAATICTVAPQAIYVWCDLLPDMEDLREELCKTLPEDVIPELVEVVDYDGLILIGELALCLQRLAK